MNSLRSAVLVFLIIAGCAVLWSFEKRSAEELMAKGQEAVVLVGAAVQVGVREVWANLFSLNSIQVRGNYRVSSEEIASAAGVKSGEWLSEISLQQSQERLGQLPWIEWCELRWKYLPTRLEIEVREAEPWLVAELDRGSWLVSRKGELISPLDVLRNSDLIVESTELTRVDGLASGSAESTYFSSANARFEYAVRAIRLIEMSGDWPFEIERYTVLDKGGLMIHPTTGTRYPKAIVRAETLEEAENARVRLSLVVKDLENRGERPSTVDLSYRNQAIIDR